MKDIYLPKSVKHSIDNSKVNTLLLLGDLAGSGQYRLIQPFEQFARNTSKSKYDVFIQNKVLLQDLKIRDLVYCHRQYSPQILNDLLITKELTGKLRYIYEIDDLLFTGKVSPNSPAAGVYNKPEIIGNVRSYMKYADAIVVSTEYLKNEVLKSKLNKNVYVCKNNITKTYFDDCKKYNITRPQDELRILWAGSNTHVDDFKTGVMVKIRKFLASHKDSKLIMFGMDLQERGKDRLKLPHDQIEYYSFVVYPYYFRLLKSFDANIGIAPLAQTEFNASKSDIKYLEYSACKYLTLAQSVGQYKDTIKDGKNGYLIEKNSDWTTKLELVYENWKDGNKKNEKIIKNAYYYTMKKRIYENNWKDWKNVIDKVMSRDTIIPSEMKK